MLDKQSDPTRSKDRIHPQAVARAVSDLARRDAVFILDTGQHALVRQLDTAKRGIEFPNPDFAALARAYGGHGFKITKPAELKDPINEAFMVDGPAIVDAVVVANEFPKLPHFDLDLIGHVALAKVKEAVLAVTGA